MCDTTLSSVWDIYSKQPPYFYVQACFGIHEFGISCFSYPRIRRTPFTKKGGRFGFFFLPYCSETTMFLGLRTAFQPHLPFMSPPRTEPQWIPRWHCVYPHIPLQQVAVGLPYHLPRAGSKSSGGSIWPSGQGLEAPALKAHTVPATVFPR